MTAAKIIRDITLAGNEIHDPLARAQQQVGALQQALRNVYAEYTGEGMKPEHGTEWHRSNFGDADVLVEYDYSPGEPAKLYGPPEKCYEGEPARADVISVLINGVWIDAAEFPANVRERWEQEIIDNEIEAAWQDRWDRAAEEAP